jgi:hypothetical protein
MRHTISLLFSCTVLKLCALGSAVSQPQSPPSRCTTTKSADTEHGQPLIYGDSYEVPALHFKLVEKGTTSCGYSKGVHIHNYWQWFQHPYPEREWGAWVDADELIDCSADGHGRLDAAITKIKASGWCDGK